MYLGRFAATEVQTDHVNPIRVNNDKFIAAGRPGIVARFSWWVTELNAKAKRLQGNALKKFTIPLLGSWSQFRRPKLTMNVLTSIRCKGEVT